MHLRSILNIIDLFGFTVDLEVSAKSNYWL